MLLDVLISSFYDLLGILPSIKRECHKFVGDFVIVEGMVVGLISWAISILFAVPITGVLCFGVGMAILTAPMPAVYGMTGIIAWLIFTLVLATIASALPARRASRLTVRDTLAYE